MNAHVQSYSSAVAWNASHIASSAYPIFSCLTVMCGRSRVSLQPEEVLAASGMERKLWRDADQYRPSYK